MGDLKEITVSYAETGSVFSTEAQVGNAKELTESPLPGISAAVDSAVTALFPVPRHSMLRVVLSCLVSQESKNNIK